MTEVNNICKSYGVNMPKVINPQEANTLEQLNDLDVTLKLQDALAALQKIFIEKLQLSPTAAGLYNEQKAKVNLDSSISLEDKVLQTLKSTIARLGNSPLVLPDKLKLMEAKEAYEKIHPDLTSFFGKLSSSGQARYQRIFALVMKSSDSPLRKMTTILSAFADELNGGKKLPTVAEIEAQIKTTCTPEEAPQFPIIAPPISAPKPAPESKPAPAPSKYPSFSFEGNVLGGYGAKLVGDPSKILPDAQRGVLVGAAARLSVQATSTVTVDGAYQFRTAGTNDPGAANKLASNHDAAQIGVDYKAPKTEMRNALVMNLARLNSPSVFFPNENTGGQQFSLTTKISDNGNWKFNVQEQFSAGAGKTNSADPSSLQLAGKIAPSVTYKSVTLGAHAGYDNLRFGFSAGPFAVFSQSGFTIQASYSRSSDADRVNAQVGYTLSSASKNQLATAKAAYDFYTMPGVMAHLPNAELGGTVYIWKDLYANAKARGEAGAIGSDFALNLSGTLSLGLGRQQL